MKNVQVHQILPLPFQGLCLCLLIRCVLKGCIHAVDLFLIIHCILQVYKVDPSNLGHAVIINNTHGEFRGSQKDAALLSDVLKRLGFEVRLEQDLVKKVLPIYE